MKYTYSALDPEGNSIEGTIDAESKGEALIVLRAAGHCPMKIETREKLEDNGQAIVGSPEQVSMILPAVIALVLIALFMFIR